LLIQGADSSPAITIAETGTTTFAENATMSGVTTLANATITAGTFPEGHVIQTRIYSTGSQVNLTSTSWNTADDIGDFQFTPIKASSNILLSACCTIYADTTANYVYTDFYKNASDVTETSNLSGSSDGLTVNRYISAWGTATYFFLDTCSENSLSEKTYKITGKTNGGGSGYLGWGANTPAKMIIQEITT
jgi:hypothetical protein